MSYAASSGCHSLEMTDARIWTSPVLDRPRCQPFRLSAVVLGSATTEFVNPRLPSLATGRLGK